MKALQNAKIGIGLSPIDATGTTFTPIAFDLGTGGPYSEVMCIVQTGNVAADMTSLKLVERDDSATLTSGTTDITGGGFTAPLATGGDNTIRCAFVPLGGPRKRYIGVIGTAGAGATLINAVWIGIPAVMPNSNTERGVTETLFCT